MNFESDSQEHHSAAADPLGNVQVLQFRQGLVAAEFLVELP